MRDPSPSSAEALRRALGALPAARRPNPPEGEFVVSARPPDAGHPWVEIDRTGSLETAMDAAIGPGEWRDGHNYRYGPGTLVQIEGDGGVVWRGVIDRRGIPVEAGELIGSRPRSAVLLDRAQYEAWLSAATERLTKRTDYPKLGYIIHRLNELGIPSVLHGQSAHGPILLVAREFVDRAWDVLSEKWTPRARKTIDDLDDEDERFDGFGGVSPDMELWEGR